VVILTSPKDQELATRMLPVGHDIAGMQADSRGQRLFVWSNGDLLRENASDERPSLTVIDGGGWRPEKAADPTSERVYREPFTVARYELEAAVRSIEVDPLGEYAVLRVSGSVVDNPNQLLLVKLPPADATKQVDVAGTVKPKTIRSFGSKPQSFLFTPPLRFPDGERRLLVVQTEREIALLDLEDPEAEITVRLAESSADVSGQPVEVVYHTNQPLDAGDEDAPRYATFAIRLANDSTIQMLGFASKDEGSASGDGAETKKLDFVVNVNLADAGGVPSDLDFFWTEVGGKPALRLAALVPSRGTAALVDPATGDTQTVDLDGAYTSMERVTDDVGTEAASSDVALLWSASESNVAFWKLGAVGSDAYRSVESYALGNPVSSVMPVKRDTSGSAATGGFKILNGQQGSGRFYLLKLAERETSPFELQGSAKLSVSPNGERVWVVPPDAREIASVDLATERPTPVMLPRSTSLVFEVSQANAKGRSLIALHGWPDDVGATVLDARAPDGAKTRSYASILLGGLQ
jgi:hypothetical protein